jgi:hypothetical protein
VICYFIVFHDRAAPQLRISAQQKEAAIQCLRAVPGLRKALLHTAEQATDPYLDDGPPPQLALQLYFDDIGALEASLRHNGPLEPLAGEAIFASLAYAEVTQQAMLARSFDVPDPPQLRDGDVGCTYLVAYPGPAQDFNAWLTHYIGAHASLMCRFPGVRAVEVCTRIDYCSGLPWRRAECMLRNAVAFASPAALTAALHSPVRHEMRADFREFPPYEGGNTHAPMETLTVLPGALAGGHG